MVESFVIQIYRRDPKDRHDLTGNRGADRQ
jgi:hypothetical protein